MAEVKVLVLIPRLDKDEIGCVLESYPVILCKDCRWYQNGSCENDNTNRFIKNWGSFTSFEPEPDWYCADGEGKTEWNG